MTTSTTAFMNVGAFVNGHRPGSKKALREALTAHPESVYFDTTSMLDGGLEFPATDLPLGVTLSISGPDPETNQRWHATLTQGGALV